MKYNDSSLQRMDYYNVNNLNYFFIFFRSVNCEKNHLTIFYLNITYCSLELLHVEEKKK